MQQSHNFGLFGLFIGDSNGNKNPLVSACAYVFGVIKQEADNMVTTALNGSPLCTGAYSYCDNILNQLKQYVESRYIVDWSGYNVTILKL